MIFQSRELLLLYDFNEVIPTLYGEPLFSVKGTTKYIYGRYFLFWGLSTNFGSFFVFRCHLFRKLMRQLLSHKRFPTVMQKSRTMCLQFRSGQQADMNLRNLSFPSIKTRNTEKNQDCASKTSEDVKFFNKKFITRQISN